MCVRNAHFAAEIHIYVNKLIEQYPSWILIDSNIIDVGGVFA